MLESAVEVVTNLLITLVNCMYSGSVIEHSILALTTCAQSRLLAGLDCQARAFLACVDGIAHFPGEVRYVSLSSCKLESIVRALWQERCHPELGCQTKQPRVMWQK